MTLPLPSRFDVRSTRLLVGIEPRDAIRQCRLTHRVDIHVERQRYTQPFAGPALTPQELGWLRSLRDARRPLHREWPRLTRHPSGRHAMIAIGTPPPDLELRLFEDRRVFVPRRVQARLDAGPPLDDVPIVRRSRTPWLWPGAAYPVLERATGLRGRVLVGPAGTQRPVRWARIVARPVAGGAPFAWAHGDDRGDFLLILPPEALGLAAGLPALTLTVEAFGRLADPPAPPPQAVRDADPWWDIPLETLALPGVLPDQVAEGRAVPPDFNGSDARQVTFTYSVILGDAVAPFVIS
jgi:hypothetical protein